MYFLQIFYVKTFNKHFFTLYFTVLSLSAVKYDPVAYRKETVLKISREVTENILKKLYPDD
ncbi:hypothetical protein MASR2M18_18010 [Ignavibacteria bacterium]|nr:hypothetical protein [Bacteroidota bacterium]MCZ2132266.1 hypothetical protein [Bacteroidota bacterium]